MPSQASTNPQELLLVSFGLLSSCILLLPIKAYAEVRVEIRGGTVLPTRRYGDAYAEVRLRIRGGTALYVAFQHAHVNRFLRGSTESTHFDVSLENGCGSGQRKAGGLSN